MKCKDCEYLDILGKSDREYYLRCRKYNLQRSELVGELKYLNCVECQKNFNDVVRSET